MVFAVPLYHAQELPTVSFIKRGMVGNQINRSDSLGFHIFHNHIEQMPCDTFAAVVFLRIDRTDIWCKIFSVVKVIFDYTHTSYNFVAIQTKIPTIFGFFPKIGIHAVQISFCWNAPFAMEPIGSGFYQFRALS